MKNWTPWVIFIVFAVIILLLNIVYVKSVVTSDLPLWFKFFLLR